MPGQQMLIARRQLPEPWGWLMAYGHAERTLAAIRLLEIETAALLESLPQLDAEQAAWLREAMPAGYPRLRATSVHTIVRTGRPNSPVAGAAPDQ